MNSIFCTLIAILCLCNSLLKAQINDCPYVFYDKNKTVVKWIEEGQLVEKTYLNDDFKKLKIKTCEDFESKYLRLDTASAIDDEQNFTEVPKIAILSDIHGQHDLFIQLMQAHNVIDEKRNWNYADGHFVIVGDVFDRGDKVTETLWFLYKLEQQAIKAGGRVHYLLGNHEIMVLKGDLRYISEKYELVSKEMGMTYDQLFGVNTLLGQWLRTKPVAITINDIAFAHAGFSPEFAEGKFDIQLANQLFHEEIIDQEKEAIMNKETLKFMVKSNGPIWYRGYFRDSTFTKQTAKEILSKMQVKNIVVGHTSMESVMSHYDGLIYSVDSSIKKGKYGEILFWENGRFFKGQLDGNRISF
ncbi:MAG: metallophosphoesterase [Reichenbachiella sp.]|uniref:metallophosphoesterase n=1 Tax=Reichenbachiella sp. TaxID=2184521 RepID=UPI00326455D4